jgi:tRNA dimethylallyltransferase
VRTSVAANHVAIVGPTASGKSELAAELCARDSRFEIVSLDSMQVYRGMDIGTAKPSPSERVQVRHHLVDVAHPSEAWSVARTQRLALAAMSEIEGRGGRALLVGGTGLYVQAVIDRLDLPGEDLLVRSELERATESPEGLRAAWEQLQRTDPDAAARLDEHNRRRIVRALEVARVTGRRFSSFGPGLFPTSGGVDSSRGAIRMLAPWTTRAELAVAIERRVDAMRRDGLVEEVELLRSGAWARSARQAIGYKEIDDALESGSSLDAAFELVVNRTRRFARRQRMWFRRDPRVVWVRASDIAARCEAVVVVCAT